MGLIWLLQTINRMENNKKTHIITAVKIGGYELGEKVNNGVEYNMNCNFNFMINSDDKTLRCTVGFLLESEGTSRVALDVSCYYSFSESYFNSFINSERSEFVLPIDRCIYFASVSLGCARGILVEKSQGTWLQNFVWPLIDLENLVHKECRFEVTK